MGQTIWVDVQGRDPNKLPNDSTMLLRLRDELDRLASKLDVAKLSDFYDYSSLEADFADEIDVELPGAGPTAAKWFNAAAALHAVRAIHDHLQKHPEDLGLTPKKG